jgi:hypothetical protein
MSIQGIASPPNDGMVAHVTISNVTHWSRWLVPRLEDALGVRVIVITLYGDQSTGGWNAFIEATMGRNYVWLARDILGIEKEVRLFASPTNVCDGEYKMVTPIMFIEKAKKQIETIKEWKRCQFKK